MKLKSIVTVNLLPMLGLLLLDQISKSAASTLKSVWSLGPFEILYFENFGFLLGSGKALPPALTMVIPATVSAFVLFAYTVIQVVLPIKSNTLRCGLSVLVAGILGNTTDRIRYGYVIDFISIPSMSAAVFNFADAIQWIGIAMILVAFVANREILYPVEQRRGRKWIHPEFQGRYCLALIGSGIFFSLVLGSLAYTFMLATLSDEIGVSIQYSHTFLANYTLIHFLVSLVFLTILHFIGIHLSYRIVGPLRGFEAYLRRSFEGEQLLFKVRKGDEFRELEVIAEQVQRYFHSQGIEATKLGSGSKAPAVVGKDIHGGKFSIESLRGRKAWIMFYRYAGCPLCAHHFTVSAELIERATEHGVKIIVVYESSSDEFFRDMDPRVQGLMQSLDVTTIADPDRGVYDAFRSRVRIQMMLAPSTYIAFIKARLCNFTQGPFGKTMGQLPSHFLIDEFGTIKASHYGRSFSDHIPYDRVLAFMSGDKGDKLQ